MPPARILSIDDSPTVLKLIEMICQNAGYEIHVARNGREGVERAIEVRPDVILVDFIMPEMNGLQVCKALQENPATREIPIILVSSKGEAVGDKFVETLGVKHYCTKPFQADDLLEKLAEVLGEQAASPATDEPKPAATVSAPATATQDGATTVLSIDDSPTILRLVEMILSHAGFDVHTAADGAAGVAMAKELHPDIILVDFIMPGMNGFQVCKALREDPETAVIPIVLVSSKGEAIGEQFVDTLKIQHYLTKPFQPEELVEEVNRILGQAAGTDSTPPVSRAAQSPEPSSVEPPAPSSVEPPAPSSVEPPESHAAEPLEQRDAESPVAAGTDYQVVALKSLLEAELAAMEGRLIAHINAKLNEVLQEIRTGTRVTTTL